MSEVIERENTAVAPVTPMRLLEIATQQGADIDRLERLMALEERWRANQAREAFEVAVAAFKANPPTVLKDKDNKQYNSKYASIGNLVNTVNAALSQQGLSARWTIDQQDKISVTCVLTHKLGHSESATMTGPLDTSGQKNPLQQIKSTVTYLKIATYEAVTGIASVEGNADDDGNGAGNLGRPEPDEPGKAKLEACGSESSLRAAWKGLTAEQRKTLSGVMNECLARIRAADAQP